MVAAGRSTRFGPGTPKQFRALGGESVVARSVRALAADPDVGGVVVVLHPDEIDGERSRETASLPGVVGVVPGGDTRAGSVRRGLDAAAGATHVIVHDAARPLASPTLVRAVVRATLSGGAAVPVVPVPDTVKEDDGTGHVARTVDRSTLRLAQTPQGARADWLREALDRADREGVVVTDEAQALERAGRKVAMVPGDPSNVKITVPEDLDGARRWAEAAGPEMRVGSGFDVHAFGDGRRLILGGVEFEGERGLLGHSDADVVLHAAMDALLGAAGLGDIGRYFPSHDADLEGVSSVTLATEVARRVREAGFEPVNVDITVVAERPRIGGRVARMRSAIASCLGIDRDRVGVKATSQDGLGAIGRGEGIACHAVAMLRTRLR